MTSDIDLKIRTFNWLSRYYPLEKDIDIDTGFGYLYFISTWLLRKNLFSPTFRHLTGHWLDFWPDYWPDLQLRNVWIQDRLTSLQNPDDCGSARKLLCNLNKVREKIISDVEFSNDFMIFALQVMLGRMVVACVGGGAKYTMRLLY